MGPIYEDNYKRLECAFFVDIFIDIYKNFNSVWEREGQQDELDEGS